MTSTEKVSAALSIVRAVADTIREVGQAPAGIVYQAFMARGYTMDDYYAVIGFLTRADLIESRGDLLIWKGAK